MPREDRRAVIYARVSSDRQADEGWSHDAQLLRLRQYAQREGLEVVDEVVATESAAKAGRGCFARAVELLRARGGPRHLLVEKADRATRNLADLLLLDELRVEGVSIHSTREGLVISAECDPSVELMWMMQVAFARHFVANLSAEVKKGMRQARRDGRWTHRAPVGYLNARIGGRAALVVDEQRRGQVMRIFEDYASGAHSVRSLAAATDLTWPSGRRLGVAAIQRMLRHPVYAGMIPTPEGLKPGQHEALVQPATWYAIQARLDGRNRKKDTPPRRFPYSAGLFSCATCGRSMLGGWSKGRSRRYGYLWCSEGCTRSVRLERLEDEIAERLTELEMPEASRLSLREAIQETHRLETRTVSVEVKRLQHEQRRLAGRAARLYDDRLDGRLSPDRYDELAAETERERDALTDSLAALEQTDRDWRAVALLAVDLACGVRNLWEEVDRFERRELLETLTVNRRIDRDRVALEWAQPFETVALAARTLQDAGGAIATGDPRWLSIGDTLRTALLALDSDEFDTLRRRVAA